MAVLLGLAVAAVYGAADFLGGLATKRSPVAAVVVLSQLCGLPLLGALVLVAGGEPTGRAFALGGAAGVFGGIGLTCLYAGLASGRMSVVAPVTAVFAAIAPVAWGLARGERPAPLAFAGAALALVAVALISRTPDEASAPTTPRRAPVLLLALVAGAGFGGVFILLAETGDGVGFWPLVAGRTTSIALLGAGALLAGQSLRPARETGARPAATIAGAGVLDMTANALYLLAARRGLLSLVAVLSSLYPASTVVLARAVLHERLSPTQLVGLVLAAGGVAMIAAPG